MRFTVEYRHLTSFVTAPITIHYELHSGSLGDLIRVYLRPWYIYIYPTYKHLSCLHPSKTAAELWETPALFFDSVTYPYPNNTHTTTRNPWILLKPW